MGKLFDKFSGGALDLVLKTKKIDGRISSGLDLAIQSIPWLVGIGCFLGGAYGLESYLAIDFSNKAIENLKKNKKISDAQQDFYKILGDKIIEESEYNKIQNKKMGKISDENSILALWKSVYDK